MKILNSNRLFSRWLVAVAIVLLPASALAQDPTFTDPEKVDKVDGVQWKASAQAGLLITTGNSRTTTISAGAKGSRVEGRNKLVVEGGLAYARSSIFLAADTNGNGTIEENEIERPSQTTTEAWLVKARYDRFFTEHNAIYGLASVAADEPAGKELVAGAQIGYSRQLYKVEAHELVAEIGYDYSFEDPVADDGVSIHSARAFLGYEGTVSKDTGVAASIESLHNVNELDTGGRTVSAFEDTRVNGKLALTTKLYEDISFRFGFSAKFDNAPSPRAPFALPYADGFVPLADELDTVTEATLIINFL